MTRATLLLLIGCSLQHVNCTRHQTLKTHSGDPFDALPGNFWYEFSSPFTESYDDLTESEAATSTPEPLPFFEDVANSTNVTVQLGSSVFLHCRVNDLRDKTVSWMRRKDDQLQLITFGLHTYSSDSRYSLSYQPTNDWRLHVQFANERDEGHYECQVSSHPPIVYTVLLHVVVPRVEVVDERGDPIPEKYYKAGSTIELRCVVSQVPHPTSYVTWRHGPRMLNYDTSRGGISVKTDLHPGGAMSRLYIANANKLDSGNYTCSLAEVAAATVAVHVLNGENPAAMQHGGCDQCRTSVQWWMLRLAAWLLLRALIAAR